MGLYSIYSGDKFRIVRKPDHDGFVLVRFVKNGRLRYLRLREIREEKAGDLQKALDEAPL